MRTLDEAPIPSGMRRRGWVLVAALIASACTTSGPKRPVAIEVHDENGFSITEGARVGAEVRADFESAMRLMQQEQYEPGIALLLKVAEAAPHLATPHIDLAIAYGQVGDLQKAEASIKRALELNPRHPVAHNELGIIYRKTGRFEEARESYEKALALYPGFHVARRNLAVLCDVYLADASCALDHYQLYTQLVPGDEAAAMWIADLRNRAGR